MGMRYIYIDTSDTFDDILSSLEAAGYMNTAEDLAASEGPAYREDTWNLINGYIVPSLKACGLEVLIIDDELDTGYIVVTHPKV